MDRLPAISPSRFSFRQARDFVTEGGATASHAFDSPDSIQIPEHVQAPEPCEILVQWMLQDWCASTSRAGRRTGQSSWQSRPFTDDHPKRHAGDTGSLRDQQAGQAVSEWHEDTTTWNDHAFWNHAGLTAWIAYRIALAQPWPVDPAEVLVAGWLHDFGKLALQALMPRSYARVLKRTGNHRELFCDVELETFGVDHAYVGGYLLARWGFPESVVTAARLHHMPVEPAPAHASQAARCLAVVQLADQAARRRNAGIHDRPRQAAWDAALSAIGMVEQEARAAIDSAVDEWLARWRRVTGDSRSSAFAQGHLAGGAPFDATLSGGAIGTDITEADMVGPGISDSRTGNSGAGYAGAADSLMAKRWRGALRHLVRDASGARRISDVTEVAARVLAEALDARDAVLFTWFDDESFAYASRAEPESGSRLSFIEPGDSGIEGSGTHIISRDISHDGGSAWESGAHEAAVAETGDVVDFAGPHQSPRYGFPWFGDATGYAESQEDRRVRSWWRRLGMRGDGNDVALWRLDLSDGLQSVLAYLPSEDSGPTFRGHQPHTESLASVFRMACMFARRCQQDEREEARLLDLRRREFESSDEHLHGRLLTAISAMAAGAAHELNNQLANISGRAQLLMANPDDERRRQWAETIVAQVGAATRIIDELIHFAKPPRPEGVRRPLLPLLDQHLQHWKRESQWGNGSLTVGVLDPGLFVYADEGHFGTILDALLDNARSAESTAIEINSTSSPSDEQVRIEITDNGCGMTPDVLIHAADPFYSHRKAGRGRGLGLSLAMRLAEVNGGKLWIESTPDIGTTVTLSLPARSSRAADDTLPQRTAGA